MGTQDSAVPWRRKRKRKQKGKKRGEERGGKRKKDNKEEEWKGENGVLVLLWPPPSYPNSEVPDGDEAVARDARESTWGQGSGYIQIPTQESSWAGTTVL